MERVDVTVKVVGNSIEITPVGGMQDNYVYEINLNGIKELNGARELEPTSVKFCTALKPAYASFESVASIVDGCNIDEEKILYHIREASRHADYVSTMPIDPNKVSFEAEQFVRVKAAHEALMSFYIDQVARGSKGQMGDVIFDNKEKLSDISQLLKELKQEVKDWLEALRGHKTIGRAKPLSVLRGSKANNPPILTPVGSTFERGV